MSLGRNNCSYLVTTSGSSVLMKPVIEDDGATAVKSLRRTWFTTWFLTIVDKLKVV